MRGLTIFCKWHPTESLCDERAIFATEGPPEGWPGRATSHAASFFYIPARILSQSIRPKLTRSLRASDRMMSCFHAFLRFSSCPFCGIPAGTLYLGFMKSHPRFVRPE